MHIVYISREYPPSRRGGGIASYLKIMAEGFAARGHRVTVIAASDDTRCSSDEVVNGVRVIRLSDGDFCIKEAEPDAGVVAKFRFLTRFHSYRQNIRAIISKLDNVDIVEVAEYGAEGLYINDLGIPVVYRLHTPTLMDHKNFSLQRVSSGNLPYYYSGKKELQILRRYARHVTSCSTSLKEWAEKYVGLDAKKIKVIFNPISDVFFNNATEERHEINTNTMFFAGTVCDWKGAGDLVEACSLLNNQGLDVTLKMAGKTGAFAQRLISNHKETPWLKILGKLPQDELKTLYSTSAVVCFPSWWENMPMVCIEAMARGAVVIGSSSGGMAEIIEDGKSGFLLPPKHPALWAEKIKEVMSLTDVQRITISAEAIKRIKDIFSLDKILDQTESYFKSVIG